MSKINSVKRLVIEDFPSEVRKWLVKLIQPLNQFTSEVIAALSGGLTIADNLKAKKYEVTIAASQAYPLKLAYTLNEKPTSVQVAYCMEDTGTPSTPSVAYCAWWSYSNNELSVTMIGLDAAKRYKLVLIAQV
jgi:hypothetical protein